jgi:hypothetical protein
VLANLLQGFQFMPVPGHEAQKLYARLYARTGTWGKLELILQGDPIPPALLEAGERLRKIWLRVEAEKELRDELEPRKRKSVTFTNDHGEVITIHGFEPRVEEKDE